MKIVASIIVIRNGKPKMDRGKRIIRFFLLINFCRVEKSFTLISRLRLQLNVFIIKSLYQALTAVSKSARTSNR
jgi:hypothetical protein